MYALYWFILIIYDTSWSLPWSDTLQAGRIWAVCALLSIQAEVGFLTGSFPHCTNGWRRPSTKKIIITNWLQISILQILIWMVAKCCINPTDSDMRFFSVIIHDYTMNYGTQFDKGLGPPQALRTLGTSVQLSSRSWHVNAWNSHPMRTKPALCCCENGSRCPQRA